MGFGNTQEEKTIGLSYYRKYFPNYSHLGADQAYWSIIMIVAKMSTLYYKFIQNE